MKYITDRAADALDLAIELVTLGEYGLEYPETATAGAFSTARHQKRAVENGDCNSRSRKAIPRPDRRRGAPTPLRRPSRPSRPLSPGSPADIIRTPRIQPDWTRVRTSGALAPSSQPADP